MKALAFTFFLSYVCVNATFFWGMCPDVTLQSDFDITKYMGTWYELVRNKDMRFEKGDCDKAVYTLNDDETVTVVNSEIAQGKQESVKGYAYCDSSDPAHCHVKFSEFAPAGDYRVVSTDYENYAIVFSCSSIGIANWRWAWVLVRDTSLGFADYLPYIQQLGIPEDALYFTDQTNCSSLD